MTNASFVTHMHVNEVSLEHLCTHFVLLGALGLEDGHRFADVVAEVVSANVAVAKAIHRVSIRLVFNILQVHLVVASGIRTLIY